jgi:hypothetical protein
LYSPAFESGSYLPNREKRSEHKVRPYGIKYPAVNKQSNADVRSPAVNKQSNADVRSPAVNKQRMLTSDPPIQSGVRLVSPPKA